MEPALATAAPEGAEAEGEPAAARAVLGLGARAVVVSDLRLRPDPDESTEIVAARLAQLVDGIVGPGLVVVAGDLVDLAACDQGDPAHALADVPRLLGSLRDFAGGDHHRVVVLAGDRDRAVLEYGVARRRLCGEYGFEVADSLDLVVDTHHGPRQVCVVHHLAPSPEAAGDAIGLGGPLPTWLDGHDALLEPTAAGRFVTSRFVYRRLLTPVSAAVVLGVLAAAVVALAVDRPAGHLLSTAVLGACAAVIVAANVALARARRRWGPVVARGAVDANQRDRAAAEHEVGGELVGVVTAGTGRPELTELGDGRFYANCGAAGTGTASLGARLGFPRVYRSVRQLSWLEIEGAADLQVRLTVGRSPIAGGSLAETVLSRPVGDVAHAPTVVAELPASAGRATPSSWPGLAHDAWPNLGRIRFRAALGLGLAGALNLLSALTPPLAERFDVVRDLVPLAAAQAATALTALAGLGLLLTGRGVRRGQRRAWVVAVGLLGASAVLHLVKGLDAEEALVTLAMLGYLLVNASAFGAPVDAPSSRRAVWGLAAVVAISTAVAVVSVRLLDGSAQHIPVTRVGAGVVQRLVGVTSIDLGSAGRYLDPALFAVGIGSLALAIWALLRPVRVPGTAGRHPAQEARARTIVAAHGRDTLAYFALRSDKHWFCWGDSLVAYAVRFGVCLVSPDPVGPRAERSAVWSAFEDFAHRQGWTVAVMGASAEWLPVYRASSMRELYIGDEAVVDCGRFTLEGSHNKRLRNAMNKIRRAGYRVDFFDPASIDGPLASRLLALMAQSRRGDVERGFSMTLGRIFDPADRGLLLAVCTDPAGEPVAFCQFAPAAGIDGYSLDLMRRSRTDTTNALTDFVVIETIAHLARQGMGGLGLNFATMRAVLAGEMADTPMSRIQQWGLGRLGSSMQIESLWHHNAKFDPTWVPRYAVFESLDHLLPAALAVSAMEAWWELPVIGRFLAPPPPTTTTASAPA